MTQIMDYKELKDTKLVKEDSKLGIKKSKIIDSIKSKLHHRSQNHSDCHHVDHADHVNVNN